MSATRLLVIGIVVAQALAWDPALKGGPQNVWAGNLSGVSVQVVDGLGQVRTRFSPSERLGARISAVAATAGKPVQYSFEILDSAGSSRLRQGGNASAGFAGNIGAEFVGIPITSFYTNAGVYTMIGVVTVDGEAPVRVTQPFEVVSPVVRLIYPGDGMTGLADNPLVFRWLGSGAASYEVQVGDPGFTRTIWRGQTSGTELSFPTQSSNPLERLSAGSEYWWQVVGKDEQGAEIARSPLPGRFTVAGGAQQKRDIEVHAVRVEGGDEEGSESAIVVEVANIGTTNEASLKVAIFVNGVSFKQEIISSLGSGQTALVKAPWEGPEGDDDADIVAVQLAASVDLLDDAPSNNLKSTTISRKKKSKLVKFVGRVVDADETGESGGIDGAKVKWEGPQNGDALTEKKGHFEVRKLPLGTYRIWAWAEGYDKSLEYQVEATKGRAYPVEFALKPAKRFTASDGVDLFFKSPAAKEAAAAVVGFHCEEIEGPSPSAVQKALRALASGKGEILSVEVKDE